MSLLLAPLNGRCLCNLQLLNAMRLTSSSMVNSSISTVIRPYTFFIHSDEMPFLAPLDVSVSVLMTLVSCRADQL